MLRMSTTFFAFFRAKKTREAGLFDLLRSLTTEYCFAFLRITPTYLDFDIRHVLEDYRLKEWIATEIADDGNVMRLKNSMIEFSFV